MSSGLERRAGLRLGLRLTLWYAVFIAVAMAAVYFVTVALLRDAMHQEWEQEWKVEQSRFEERWGSRAYRMMTSRTSEMVALPPAAQKAIERHFAGVFPLLIAPIVIVALGLGLLWTLHTTRPLRRLADTVQSILETGDLDRRVTAGSGPPELAELIELFNRMLARNEALVSTIHDSFDNVAHDLRTPMTRMRAAAEAALETSDPAAARDALADCLEESDQVLRLLTSLMDVAEAEAGAMKLVRIDVSVPELLREVVDLYDLVAEEKEVRVELDAPSELRVEADRDRLRQVFANLLDNAIKFSPQGGVVAIRAAESGENVRVEFRDQGPGISSTDAPRIWDRLYRGDAAAESHGLGLGLSLVRAIAEAHGGNARVEKSAVGSSFVVELPRHEPR